MDIDLDALLETFRAETREHLDQFEAEVIAWEGAPGDLDPIKTVYRLAHTVKGDASLVGYGAMMEFAHELENLLEKASAGAIPFSKALATRLLESVDALRELLADGAEAALSAPQRKLLARLRAAAGETRADPASEPAAPAPANGHAPGEQSHSLRVGIDKLDRMMSLIGELAVARGRIDGLLAELSSAGGAALQDAHRDLDRYFSDLQEQIMAARMVPIATLFGGYSRAVRDLSAQVGKRVELRIEGGETEVDTAVADRLREPLTHLVRNSIDHGIESAGERKRAGKPAQGTLTLTARHETGFVIVEAADDGAGLVREKLLERARGRLGAENPEAMDDAALQQLIFEPGFSTAREVTNLSGRGVGLDIVRRAVESLRGTIAVRSSPGAGTTFTLRLPLTLAIIEGFGIEAADESYILPLDAIDECVDLAPDQRHEAEGTGVLNLRGEALAYLNLETHFGFPASLQQRKKVVVIHHEGRRAGIAVDELLGGCQVVVKPLGTVFRRTTGVAGSAILGTGRVAMVLDIPALLRETLIRAGHSASPP